MSWNWVVWTLALFCLQVVAKQPSDRIGDHPAPANEACDLTLTELSIEVPRAVDRSLQSIVGMYRSRVAVRAIVEEAIEPWGEFFSTDGQDRRLEPFIDSFIRDVATPRKLHDLNQLLLSYVITFFLHDFPNEQRVSKVGQRRLIDVSTRLLRFAREKNHPFYQEATQLALEYLLDSEAFKLGLDPRVD